MVLRGYEGSGHPASLISSKRSTARGQRRDVGEGQRLTAVQRRKRGRAKISARVFRTTVKMSLMVKLVVFTIYFIAPYNYIYLFILLFIIFSTNKIFRW